MLTPSHSSSKTFKDLLWLLILFGILFWGLSNIRPFANPDEGRYVEIPREILETGNWITPRLNGVLYFEKPPAFYWLQAIALHLGGIQEWVGRFWNCTFAIVGILGTYLIGRHLGTRRAALCSSIALGTCPVYFAMGHIITLDMMVSCFIALAMYAFIYGRSQPFGSLSRRLFFYFFYFSLAVATLTKGLMALLLPGAILFIWIGLTNRWHEIKHYFVPSGIVLYLAVAVPWHILAAQETPAFAWFYLVHEQFLRYLKPIHGRSQPFWFFPAIFLVGTFPWSLFIVQTFKEFCQKKCARLKQNPVELLLAIWCLFFIVFFSFSSSKLIPYILPSFFPFSLLFGSFLDKNLQSPAPSTKISCYAGACILILGGIIQPLVLIREESFDTTTQVFSILVLIISLIGGFLVIRYTRLKQYLQALLTLLVTMLFLLACVNPLLKSQRMSTKVFALHLKTIVQPQDTVYQLYNYYQDFAPYLGQKTHVVDTPDEQSFGLELEDLSSRYPKEKVFFNHWHSDDRVYGIIRTKHMNHFKKQLMHPQRFFIILQNKDFLLITNHPL